MYTVIIMYVDLVLRLILTIKLSINCYYINIPAILGSSLNHKEFEKGLIAAL